MLQVTEYPGRHFVTVLITTDDPKLIQAEVDTYFKRWPTAGYATRVISEAKELSGLYVVKLDRYASCE